MRNNGSPDAIFETDDQRSYLSVTLPVHRGFLEVAIRTKDLTPTAYKILQSCLNGPMSSTQLASILGISSNSGNLRRTITYLIDSGLLNYMIPGKPRSASQKYMLTSAGEELAKTKAD